MTTGPSGAVFVDAGYLFAQGSAALTGAKKPRAVLQLDAAAAVSTLTAFATQKSFGATLLRVYWYDGARSARNLPADHASLAHMDYTKLRLGFITSHGQQKGVDSLIVTNMIELARNHAMSDAVLLSGDEDIRIGVQIAQSFGVRIHLLGITPCRGSQSIALMQEADTTSEWDTSIVGRFLTVLPSFAITQTSTLLAASATVPASVSPSNEGATSSDLIPTATREAIDEVVSHIGASLSSTDVVAVLEFWDTGRGLPSHVDGRLLAQCRAKIRRDLSHDERRLARNRFGAFLRPSDDAT